MSMQLIREQVRLKSLTWDRELVGWVTKCTRHPPKEQASVLAAGVGPTANSAESRMRPPTLARSTYRPGVLIVRRLKVAIPPFDLARMRLPRTKCFRDPGPIRIKIRRTVRPFQRLPDRSKTATSTGGRACRPSRFAAMSRVRASPAARAVAFAIAFLGSAAQPGRQPNR